MYIHIDNLKEDNLVEAVVLDNHHPYPAYRNHHIDSEKGVVVEEIGSRLFRCFLGIRLHRRYHLLIRHGQMNNGHHDNDRDHGPFLYLCPYPCEGFGNVTYDDHDRDHGPCPYLCHGCHQLIYDLYWTND